jgi:hypothetical protein
MSKDQLFEELKNSLIGRDEEEQTSEIIDWLRYEEHNFDLETLETFLHLPKNTQLINAWGRIPENKFDIPSIKKFALLFEEGHYRQYFIENAIKGQTKTLDIPTIKELAYLFKQSFAREGFIERLVQERIKTIDIPSIKILASLFERDYERETFIKTYVKDIQNNPEAITALLPLFSEYEQFNLAESMLQNPDEEIKYSNVIKFISDEIIFKKSDSEKVLKLIKRIDFPTEKIASLCIDLYPNSKQEQSDLLNGLIRNGIIINSTDAFFDYAKNLLGPKLARAINSDTEIPEEAKNGLDLDKHKETLLKYVTTAFLNNIPFSERLAFVKAFSDAWHSIQQQQKIAKLKDYNGESWPSLFGTKEIEIPAEVTGQAGYKLVTRTTPAELTEEGKKLEHCVGGYTSQCNTGSSHIVSIVNPQGEPISTLEYKSTPYNNGLKLVQHHAKKNATPSKESLAIEKWFEKQIDEKAIVIDHQGLEEARAARVAKAETFEQKIILYFGYNPFDNKKNKEVVETYKDLAETTEKGVKAQPAQEKTDTTPAREAKPAIPPVKGFDKCVKDLFNVKLITITNPFGEIDPFTGEPFKPDNPFIPKITFSLEEKKEIGKKKEKIEINQDDIRSSIQTSIDKILGEDKVTATINPNPKKQHGDVILTPKDPKDIDDISATLISKRLSGKFEKTDTVLKSTLDPLPTRKLLEGIANQEKSRGV